jgi:hypothetical protein
MMISYEGWGHHQADRSGRLEHGVAKGKPSSVQASGKTKRRVTVAGKPGVDVPIGTLKNIYRQAQIEEEEQ